MSVHKSYTTEVTCSECGTTEPWDGQTWCPVCGYHPASGGKFEPTVTYEGQAEESLTFFEILPPWMWFAGIGVIAIVGGSFAARFMYTDPAVLTWITVVGATIGALMLFTGQLSAYLAKAAKDCQLSPFDIVMKPFQIWQTTFRNLPQASWRVLMAAWGLTAIVSSLLIVGGIDFNELFEEIGPEPSPAPNLVQEIIKRANKNQGKGDGDLDNSIQQFTGQAASQANGGGEDSDAAKEEKKKNEETPFADLLEADCIVLGYVPLADGRVARLLIASVRNGRLSFAGAISARTLPLNVREKLDGQLPGIRTASPVIHISKQYKALWVEPKVILRLAFEDWPEHGVLAKPQFVEMLSKL